MDWVIRILLVKVFLINFTLCSQTIKEVEFITGYKIFKNGNFAPLLSTRLEPGSDSTVYLSFYEADSSINRVKRRVHFTINEDLKTIDTNIIWERNGAHVPFFFGGEQVIRTGIIQNPYDRVQYRFYINSLNDSTTQIELYTIKNGIVKDSLLFSKTLLFRIGYLTPYVYRDKCILISLKKQSNIEEIVFESFQVNSGQLLVSRTEYNSSQTLNFLQIQNYQNPRQYLNSDSLFSIEGSPNLGKVVVFNLQNFNLHKETGITDSLDLVLAFQKGVADFKGRKFYIDSTGVEIAGEMLMTDGLNTTNYQMGVIKITNHDSILSIQQFGDTLKDESAFNYIRTDSSSYLIGNSPRPVGLLGKNPLLIYHIHSMGYDSLLIAGQNGYAISEGAVLSPTGDLYISSTYANNPTSDSNIVIVVTRIPNEALSIAKKFRKNNKQTLLVYPNPSSDFIRSERFVAGENYLIYDMSGKLVQRGTIPSEEHISIASFEKGTYVLQLIREKRAVSVLFVKQ